MAKLPYSGPSLNRLLAGQNRARPRDKAANGSGRAGDSPALLQRGLSLQIKGDLGLAAELYQAALRENPKNPDALHLMGTVALAAGQVDAAIDLFKRAVAGKPADPAIRCNLANALLQKDDAASAESHLRRALKADPNLPAALCFLADCKTRMGDVREAVRLYESVLQRIPEHSQALIGYADLCVTLGDVARARSLYRKARGTVPALALAGLAACEKLPRDSAEANEINRMLRQPGLKPIEYASLSHAAGNIAENAGEYDEAFQHFLNAKKAGGASFDSAAHRQTLATLKGLFTKAFFETRARHGDASTRPVFIVGMPRSGTTLVEQIISRHPEAAAGGELRDITRIATSLGFRAGDATGFAKRVTALGPSEAKALARDYLSVLKRVSLAAARVTDKMPHNFQQLGLIALLFPNARIVHCRRDPFDTCLSCFTTQLKSHNHGYASDLATLAEYYREYFELMGHWRQVLPTPMMDVDYEGLIDAPEGEIRKLIAFVGLSWDPACLSPQESARPVSTQSRVQVRQPIYRTSIGRWRRYEKHLGRLKAALGDLAQASKGE